MGQALWRGQCTCIQGRPEVHDCVPAAVERSLTLSISPCSRSSLCQIMFHNWNLPPISSGRLPLRPGKADLIPVEILSEIFLLAVLHGPEYQRDLMLVCRRWHAILLSTPGIHSQLTIRRATQKEVVQAFIQGRKSRLHMRVDMNDEKDGSDFNPETFHACFMAAAQAASRWSSLNLISPPPREEYKALQILQPLVHLESIRVACDVGEFLESLMTAISRCDSPNLTIIHLEDPTAVLYLVQPACLYITHSLTTLKVQLSKRMGGSVDILPHLHRLNTFEARNLCLPFYPPDACLPLTHTLRFLHLKSVSVQWMAGHVFPALEHCDVKFPRHADIIRALQPVRMPSCFYFQYHSNDLHPLAQFHLPSLRVLDVKCGQWNVWRGNPQLAALCPVAAAGAKSLTELQLDIECSEQLLLYMLSLVPALTVLWLGLARPNALSTAFFQAFIVREPNADGSSDMVGPPGQATAPLCPLLESLDLQYRRWLRGPDKKALIIAFGDIMTSRNLKESHPSFKLLLSVDQALYWSNDKPVRKLQDLRRSTLMMGISAPCGIIPISTALPWEGVVALPLKGAEYLHLRGTYWAECSVEFLFTNDHMELVVYHHDQRPPPTSLPCVLPLFNALRVLVVEDVIPSFLIGHTFHKLERCRLKSSYLLIAPLSRFTETEMPLCTRMDISDPHLLSAFKLPLIHELALDFSHPDCSTIWEKHIAVNTNLSGLTLLHIKQWWFDGDLVSILRSLPLLETLIISSSLSLVSLGAFLPMDANATRVLKQASGEGRALALLCPRLQSLRIEGQDPSAEPELIPILKDIVVLRAEFGSPLMHFTFPRVWFRSLFELVGTNGSFTMEKIVLPGQVKPFELDI